MSDFDTLYANFDADWAAATAAMSDFAGLYVSEAQYHLAGCELERAWTAAVPGRDMVDRVSVFDLARDHRMGDDS